jgi:hypothetical protein
MPRGITGAVRAVARGAGRNAALRIAAAEDALAQVQLAGIGFQPAGFCAEK